MKRIDINTKYHNGVCTPKFGRYCNNNIALQLIDPFDGGQIMTASVNPNESLPDNEIAIKNWSENEGVEGELIRIGFIAPAHRHVRSGFVEISIHKLLVDPNEFMS